MVTPSPQSDSNSVVEAAPTASDTTDSTAVETPPSSADSSIVESGSRSWLYAVCALFAVYGLFATIDLLTIGFQLILGEQAEALLPLAVNPWLGLLLGILATALVQSSSVVTALLVALVAGGLPIATAIPMVMGANLGTTVTNTLVSLGYIGDDAGFERGFAAATVHDCFNLLALIIFFPLELLLHPLEKLTHWIVAQNPSIQFLPANVTFPIDWLLQPSRWLTVYSVNKLPGPWDSLLLFSTSVGGLMIAVTTLGWLMKQWFDTPAQTAIRSITGHSSGIGGLAAGAGLTALLQSSSMTTSLAVPLAGAGLVTLEDIYPFVLGTNIGTCITALLATLAVNSPVALQLALVHLSYNSLAVFIIYSVRPLRLVPLTVAKKLAAITRRDRIFAVAYVIGVFFLLPFLALWLSLLAIA
ncbi:MAG: Na/Pi symporter [Leptolyngbyaceae cyanobacterium]